MSHHPQITHPVAARPPVTRAYGLRNLYAARFVFAALWAGVFALSASALTPVSVTLLVLYPVFDVAAAVADLRAPGEDRSRIALRVNVGLSASSAVALGIAASSGMADVLRVWGAWAVVAGLVQVVVATRRGRLEGQRVQALSGAISVVAGTAFVAMAAGPDVSLAGLAGYGALGGIFFLISAVRLHRGMVTPS